MGSRGDAHARATAGRSIPILGLRCLAKHRFTTRTEIRLAVFRHVEGWTNAHRRHSALRERRLLASERAHVVGSFAAQESNLTGSTESGEVQVQREEEIVTARKDGRNAWIARNASWLLLLLVVIGWLSFLVFTLSADVAWIAPRALTLPDSSHAEYLALPLCADS
jgi:hypothetical protein